MAVTTPAAFEVNRVPTWTDCDALAFGVAGVPVGKRLTGFPEVENDHVPLATAPLFAVTMAV
jgi:hypothetical protein